MSVKADFNPEEWQSLLQTPMAIVGLVTLASPAIGDALKESMAAAAQIGELVQDSRGSQLLAALAEEFKNRQTAQDAQIKMTTRDPQQVKAQLLGVVSSAVTALNAKASPEEAAQMKQWLLGVGQAAANAAKEGDFFGIGGKKVSEEEEAVLAEIKAALGL